MTSPFTALSSRLSGAVDGAFGEVLRFIPKAKTDNFGKPVAADARQQADVIGTLTLGSADISFADGDRRLSDFNARAIRFDAQASFDISRFAAGSLPRKGDAIRSADGAMYEVVDALPAGARIALLLVRA